MEGEGAVLKVKQVCGAKWTGDVTISLDATAAQLKTKLQALTGQPVETMKLMCSGKILKNELSLKDQRVGSSKASSMLMLMEDLTAKKMEIEQTEEKKMLEETQVERTLAAAQDLASRVDTGEEAYAPQTLEIYNQSGQKVNLLPGDEKALVVGMTLHDRGKSLVKKGDLKTAAQMFLRAESEGFAKCSTELLAMVDNYGLLCLDIAWTYFQLQDLTHLQDAGWRLQKAEECLEKTYGRNMERLKRLKGGAPEMILYVRLHLLRAVAAYYKGDLAGSTRHLDEVEQKLQSLKISDEELVGLIGMGFSASESRVALRACERSQEAAVAYLLNKREQQRAAREEDRRRREERRERRKAGKTVDGRWVDVGLVRALVGMGFARRLATEALRQANNDEAAAITLLTESPEVLQAALRPEEGVKTKSRKQSPVPEDQIELVTALGFTRAQAVGTLRLANNNAERAINLLLEGRGVEAEDAGDANAATAATTPSSSTTSTTEAMEEEAKPHEGTAAETEEERRRREEAEERLERERQLQRQTENELLESVEEDADAHLDVSLEDEFAVLARYRELLAQQQAQS